MNSEEGKKNCKSVRCVQGLENLGNCWIHTSLPTLTLFLQLPPHFLGRSFTDMHWHWYSWEFSEKWSITSPLNIGTLPLFCEMSEKLLGPHSRNNWISDYCLLEFINPYFIVWKSNTNDKRNQSVLFLDMQLGIKSLFFKEKQLVCP